MGKKVFLIFLILVASGNSQLLQNILNNLLLVNSNGNTNAPNTGAVNNLLANLGLIKTPETSSASPGLLDPILGPSQSSSNVFVDLFTRLGLTGNDDTLLPSIQRGLAAIGISLDPLLSKLHLSGLFSQIDKVISMISNYQVTFIVQNYDNSTGQYFPPSIIQLFPTSGDKCAPFTLVNLFGKIDCSQKNEAVNLKSGCGDINFYKVSKNVNYDEVCHGQPEDGILVKASDPWEYGGTYVLAKA